MPVGKRPAAVNSHVRNPKRFFVAEVALWNKGATLLEIASVVTNAVEKQQKYIDALNCYIGSLEYTFRREPAGVLEDIYAKDTYKIVNALHQLSLSKITRAQSILFLNTKINQNSKLLQMLQHERMLTTAETNLTTLLQETISSYNASLHLITTEASQESALSKKRTAEGVVSNARIHMPTEIKQQVPSKKIRNQNFKAKDDAKSFDNTNTQTQQLPECPFDFIPHSVDTIPVKYDVKNMLKIPEFGAPVGEGKDSPSQNAAESNTITCQKLLICYKTPNERLSLFARETYANKDKLRAIQQAEFKKLKADSLSINDAEIAGSELINRLYKLAIKSTKESDYLSAIEYLNTAIKMSIDNNNGNLKKLLVVKLLSAIDQLCSSTRKAFAENTHLDRDFRVDSELEMLTEEFSSISKSSKKKFIFQEPNQVERAYGLTLFKEPKKIHHYIGAEIFLCESKYVEKLEHYINVIKNEYLLIVNTKTPVVALILDLKERNKKDEAAQSMVEGDKFGLISTESEMLNLTL